LTKAHNFAVGSSLRIEIGAALAAADRHAGERILDDLLEAKKLDGAEINAGMKPKAPLERAERGVELHTEAARHLHLGVVVHPGETEDNVPLGLADPLDQRTVDIVGMFRHDRAEAVEHFPDRLMEFLFAWIAAQYGGINRFELFI